MIEDTEEYRKFRHKLRQLAQDTARQLDGTTVISALVAEIIYMADGDDPVVKMEQLRQTLAEVIAMRTPALN